MTTIQDRIIKDLWTKFNPDTIWVVPSKDNIQTIKEIEQFILTSIKEVQEETRKEITDDLGKLMDIDRARKLGDNLEIYQGKRECPICGANPEKQREMILSITNKEKQK